MPDSNAGTRYIASTSYPNTIAIDEPVSVPSRKNTPTVVEPDTNSGSSYTPPNTSVSEGIRPRNSTVRVKSGGFNGFALLVIALGALAIFIGIRGTWSNIASIFNPGKFPGSTGTSPSGQPCSLAPGASQSSVEEYCACIAGYGNKNPDTIRPDDSPMFAIYSACLHMHG